MRKRILTFAYIVAIGVWGLLSYGALSDYMREGTLFARMIDKHPYVNDYVNTYSASILAQRCLSGNKVNVYDPQVQDREFRKLIAPVAPERPFYFQYPPHYFLLVLPLALASLNASWVIWNVAFWAAGIFALRKTVSDLPRPVFAAAAVLAISSYPFWVSAQLGQTSLIIFPLASAFFELLRRKRFAWAGVAAAVASVKLQYFPAFALIGALVGGWPFMATTAVVLAAWLALTAGVLGLDNILRFPHALVTGETGQYFTGVNAFAMQNFRGELWLLLHGEHEANRYLTVAVFLIGLGVIGWLWWRNYFKGLKRIATDEADIYRLASLSVLIMLVTSLHTHVQDYVLATLPCLWIWNDLNRIAPDQRTRRQRFTYSLIQASPLLSWVFLFVQPMLSLVFVQPFLFWAVLLLVLIVLPQPRHTET